MNYDVSIRPIYYASVSGGKDSLYMLKLILSMPEKYPLDMVVHYELEIDWDWVKRVVDYMESECIKRGIKFMRIRPRQTWSELYQKYDLPSRRAKWCNGRYKMDCDVQLRKWIKEQNCRPVAYIGFCADEVRRFKYQLDEYTDGQRVCYPLAHEGINEIEILQWAKNCEIFGDWYKHFQRQGCMICPNIKYKELAYLKLHQPEVYDNFMNMVEKWESRFGRNYFQSQSKYNVDYVRNIVDKKYIPQLLSEEYIERR